MIPTKRINNWPRALEEFVSAHHATPFAWGSHDCALFSASAIRAITGEDPAAELRGIYHTPLGAARLFHAHGGFETMIDTICADHGWPAQSVDFARRGDLVLHGDDRRLIAGICIGARSAFAAPVGLTFYATAECLKSWRIA